MPIDAGTVMSYLDMDTSKYTNALQTAQAQATAFTEEGTGLSGMIDGFGAGLTTVGRAMTMGVTLPLVGIGVAAVTTGMKFDESMSTVAALSGTTGTKFDELRAKALEMGSTTKYTASQAADAMGYMALAGWDADQMMAGLPGVLSLAAAANMDLARASDIVTDTMTPFGLAASEAGRVSDVFAKAQATSNTNVEQIGEAMKYAASSADAFGMSIEQTTAVVGIFANSGIKGSMAGTTFTSMMTDMKNAMEGGAIAIGQASISMVDAQGNYREFPDLIRDIEAATYGMSESERDAALSAVFQTRGMKGILALLKEGSEGLYDYTEELENADGAAEEMAETMQDNLKGDLTIFKSSVEGAAIALSDFLVPGLRKGVQWLTSAVNWFNNLDPAIKNTVFRIGTIAAAIGPALMVGGKLISAFSGVIPVLGLLGAGFALVYNHSERLQGFVQHIRENIPVWMDGLKTGYESFRTALADGQGTIDAIRSGIEAAFGSRAATNVSGTLRAVLSGFRAARGYITSAMSGVGEFVGSLIDGEGAAEAMRQALEITFGREFAVRAEGTIVRIDNALQTIKNTALQFAQSARETFAGLWEDVQEDYETGGFMGVLEGLGRSLYDAMVQGASAAREGAVYLRDKIGEGLSFTGDWIMSKVLGDSYTPDSSWGNVGSSIWTTIKGGFSTTGDWIKGLVLGDSYTPDSTWADVGGLIWTEIQAGFSTTGDWIKGLVLGDSYTPDSSWADAGASIWTTIQGGFSTTGDWIKGLVLGDSYTPDSTWGNVGSSIWTTIKGGFSTTGDWIKGLVLGDRYTPDSTWADAGASIWTAIKGGFSTTGDWIKGLVLSDSYTPDSSWADAGGTIWTAIKGGFSTTGDWIKGLVLSDSYTPDASWSDVGIAILDKIKWAKDTLTEKAGEWLNNLGTALSSDEAKAKVTEITGVVATIAGKIVSGVGAWKTTAATLIGDLIVQLTDSEFLQTAVTGLGGIVTEIAKGIGAAAVNITGCAAELITTLSNKFAETGFIESAFTTGADIVLSIAGALASAAGNMATAASKLAIGLINGFASLNWKTIFTRAGEIVGSIAKVLSENASQITTAALDLGLQLLEGLAGVDWATISYNLSVALGNMVTAISNWFTDPANIQKLNEVGGEIAGGIIEGLWTSFKNDLKKEGIDLDDIFTVTNEEMGLSGNSYFIDGRWVAVPKVSVDPALKVDETGVKTSATEASKQINDTIGGIVITNGMPDLGIDPSVFVDETQYTKTAQTVIDTTSETLDAGKNTVQESTKTVTAAMLTPFEELPEDTKAQAALVLVGVNQAIEAGTPEAVAAIELAGNAVFDKAKEILSGPAGIAVGSVFMTGILIGALSVQGAFVSAIHGIGTSGLSAIASAMNTTSGYGIGQSMVQAVISGAGSMASALASRMYGLGLSAVSAFKSAIQMQSPPKAFTDIGEAIPDAVGLGTDKNRDAAINPMLDLARDMQSAFSVSLHEDIVTTKPHTTGAGNASDNTGGNRFEFNFHGDINVREEGDVERVAHLLYQEVSNSIRGGGQLA